ncbi:MAG: SDR family NAD(P)-dependent oxidoreductase [Gammaproteobacteria bacterium]|nr:SDR family NAD(P)-dependent oxidoreductase [Gammaproteobacteria bacterium]
MKDSDKRIVLITGASRGVGKGTALALSDKDTITYITGRSQRSHETSPLPGTLPDTARDIEQRGGTARAVACDHSDDAQIKQLIETIIAEQGRLDILVNNVYQVPDDLLEWKPFWERPLDQHWHAMIDIGMRAHYVAARYAAPHMVARKSGMMVNISSPAARAYIHSVIYGLGKAATDKMMHDMAKELREHNVAALALWPGIVKTERLQPALEADALPPDYEPLKSGMESPEFSGRIIDALWRQGLQMQHSGRSWWNSELAKALGVTDVDGHQPDSYAAFMGEPGVPPEAMIQ